MKYSKNYPYPVRLINKRLFSDGEWIDEKDKYTGIYKGFRWAIMRHPEYGHLCGYVKLNYSIPNIDEDSFDVHGGITYNECSRYRNHWIGFDCDHAGDYSPGTHKITSRGEGKYRNKDYVTIEIIKLIDQLIEHEKEIKNVQNTTHV